MNYEGLIEHENIILGKINVRLHLRLCRELVEKLLWLQLVLGKKNVIFVLPWFLGELVLGGKSDKEWGNWGNWFLGELVLG